MDIVIFFFAVLLAVLAVIAAIVVINLRKREPEPEEEATHKAQEEQERNEKGQQKKEKALGEKQRPPLERGGRPRVSTKGSKREQEPEIKPRFLKAEVVCWNEGWRWVVGIEVTEEMEGTSVVHNGELLKQDSTDESRYCLKHAEGTVKVTWTGGEKDISLVEPPRNYLIFKMRKNWKEPGRLVRCSTTGYYLIVVPQEWKRHQEVSDHAPVAPESVQLEGHMAHFFYQEKDGNTVIGFINTNGELIKVKSGSPRFQLIGKEIGDASEYMGPLFGEQPPQIQTLDEKGWSDVGVIIVGEEGSGRNIWRTQFVPEVGTKEQKLPEEISNRRGGWYFVRIYDKDENLLESMDFRFIISLKDIRINSTSCLPGPKGYDDVVVQFFHQTGCKIELIDGDIQHALEVRRENGQTSVTVPPQPDFDETRWILRQGDAKIVVTVLVERIWWACGSIEGVPTNWVDKPITLPRRNFTAVTDKALWFRLPRFRYVGKIDVGFDRAKSRSYRVEVEKKELVIPLRYFCDAQEIENQQEKTVMKIWLEPEGTKTYESLVIKVPAERPHPIEQKKRGAQKIILKKEKVSVLQVVVLARLSPSGKRKGKGFSRKELTELGITIEDAKYFHIHYDKRRKTLHSWNVESLKYELRGNQRADVGG